MLEAKRSAAIASSLAELGEKGQISAKAELPFLSPEVSGLS
ncbi:hypothetical protein EKH55_5082 [Sinorhizobium alkalisoli]|nr:hypothetical protein EKH55_5082 [Sinorhizobium alkalisoli]